MQVSTQEIPFREESSLSLVPLAQGSSVRPQAGTHAFDAAQLPASCNLLDTSNRFGYTAAASASSSGFTLAQTSQIKSAFQRNEAAALAQGVHVDTQGQPVHFVRFAYADLYVAAVLQNGVLLLFSLKQLAQGQTVRPCGMTLSLASSRSSQVCCSRSPTYVFLHTVLHRPH